MNADEYIVKLHQELSEKHERLERAYDILERELHKINKVFEIMKKNSKATVSYVSSFVSEKEEYDFVMKMFNLKAQERSEIEHFDE